MKIDPQRSSLDIDAAEAARKAAPDRGAPRTGDRAAVGRRDTVEVSANAQLLSAAVKATTDAPAVRSDVVERMREKLAAGEVGQDAGRLADRLIDDLLRP